MSLGEISPLDSFGNQIWKPEPDPRNLAKLFLQLIAVGNKEGLISNKEVKLCVSGLRAAIFDKAPMLDPDARIPLPIEESFEEYEERMKMEKIEWDRARDEKVALAPLPIDVDTVNPIQEWIDSQGGLDNVLKAIQKNGWPDTSSWEKGGKRFTVADIKRFGKT